MVGTVLHQRGVRPNPQNKMMMQGRAPHHLHVSITRHVFQVPGSHALHTTLWLYSPVSCDKETKSVPGLSISKSMGSFDAWLICV